MIGGGGAPGVEHWPVLDRVDTAAQRHVEALEEVDAMLGKHRIGGLLRSDGRERAVVGIGIFGLARRFGFGAWLAEDSNDPNDPSFRSP